MLVNMLVFMIVLLIYLHVFYHLKTSNDLDIYEHDLIDKNNLEEVLNSRQPVLIDLNNNNINTIFSFKNLSEYYKKYEINIRKNDIPNDFVDKNIKVNYSLFTDFSDNDNKYYSENNQFFLEKTGLIDELKKLDVLFKPAMTSNSSYDVLIGCNEVSTRYKYDLCFRNFLYVSDGSAVITLSPPNSEKYMECYKDYYNFEFISSINPNLKTDEVKTKKFSKIIVNLKKGQVFHIPAYWWYSIKFDNSIITQYKYKTYMNQLTILPEQILCFMQRQNTKKKTQNKVYKENNELLEKTEENIVKQSIEKVEEKVEEKKNKKKKMKKLEKKSKTTE